MSGLAIVLVFIGALVVALIAWAAAFGDPADDEVIGVFVSSLVAAGAITGLSAIIVQVLL